MKLVIAGKETDNNILKQIANEKTLFLGTITDDEKKDLMKNCKFCIFPSEYESFGLVILEAVTFNKGILVSNIPAFNELINDKYFIFDNNITSLNKKIIEFNKNIKVPKIVIPNQEKEYLKLVKSFEK
jgi:glycosyltransferase involved in cell wall biosynthesis